MKKKYSRKSKIYALLHIFQSCQVGQIKNFCGHFWHLGLLFYTPVVGLYYLDPVSDLFPFLDIHLTTFSVGFTKEWRNAICCKGRSQNVLR